MLRIVGQSHKVCLEIGRSWPSCHCRSHSRWAGWFDPGARLYVLDGPLDHLIPLNDLIDLSASGSLRKRIGLGHLGSCVDGVNDELELAIVDGLVDGHVRICPLFVVVLNVGDVLRINEAGISVERILATDLVRDHTVLRGVLLPSVAESRTLESLQCAEMEWIKNALKSQRCKARDI